MRLWSLDDRLSKSWVLREGHWIGTGLDRPNAQRLVDAHNAEVASLEESIRVLEKELKYIRRKIQKETNT